MKVQFEPLLEGLYSISKCMVLLLDSKGAVLFKHVPHNCPDLHRSNPEILFSYVEQIKSLTCPLLLSAQQKVGGLAFADGSILVVGPLEVEKDRERERDKDQDSERDGHRERERERERERKSSAVLSERRNAVNVQLESISWIERRVFGAAVELLPQDEAVLSTLQQGGGIESLVVSELSKIKEILPDWAEVVPEGRPHSSYVYELAALDAITRGDARTFVFAQLRRRNGQNGVIGYSTMRAKQNIAICAVVLNSRAAIAGGLSAEQAYTIADFLILAIERATKVEQIDLIVVKSGVIYSRLVYDLKQKTNTKSPLRSLSKRAMDVIRRYLYTKVDRLKIAADLNVNPDYLDRVLKDDCHTTVMECLRLERIEEAKKLLVQSSTPIGDIATMLLFSHSSHFGKVFKEVTGVTPKAYRQRHKYSSPSDQL